MYNTGWVKSRRALDCLFTFMVEILGWYWQILDRSGKKIILLSPLVVTQLLIFVLYTSVVQLQACEPHVVRGQILYGPQAFSLLIVVWMLQQVILIRTRITSFNTHTVQYCWRNSIKLLHLFIIIMYNITGVRPDQGLQTTAHKEILSTI